MSATSIRSVMLMTEDEIVIGMDRLSSVFASVSVGRTAGSSARTRVSPRASAACTSMYAAATTSPMVTPSTVSAATTGSSKPRPTAQQASPRPMNSLPAASMTCETAVGTMLERP